MKGNNKFQLAIILSVLLLVVTFAVVFLRPTYTEDDWPVGVVHNYLLALQRQEFERAYGYLSPTLEGYPPSVDRFAANILDHRDEVELYKTPFISYDLERLETKGDEAVVSGRWTVHHLFHTTTSATFTMRLRQIDGAWKIYDSEGYWLDCWQEAEGCS